jgi:peptide/nickel transport system substrate-binding protein
MRRNWTALVLVAVLVGLLGGTGCAATPTSATGEQDLQPGGGVLTIGRREDSTTFDPIATTQNVDFWVLSTMYDVLVRVDRTGTKLEPGLAESWTVSDDGLTYRFTLRSAKFSDGSPITAGDAAFTLLRLRDDPESLWAESYKPIATVEAVDDRTLVVTLTTPSAPFLSTLAMPGASIISKAAFEAVGEKAYAENPVVSGSYKMRSWHRGDRVILEKNPNFWQADRVRLDGVEWISVPDDNTRMLEVQGGELDAALFVPFSRVAELQKDENIEVHLDPSTREDQLLINNEHGKLASGAVRQALGQAIDVKAIVDVVTSGIGEVADSYIPKGALYHYAGNVRRPHDPEAAKTSLAQAGATDLRLDYVVDAGNEVQTQTAVLIQQQLAQAGVTAVLREVDSSQYWDTLVNGNYDIATAYWTNDIVDPDQKTTFALGHDSNNNFMTRYRNDAVRNLVAAARVEPDPVKREAMYVDLQKAVAEDVPWVDLYYSPYVNVSRKTVQNFYQNPLGRFFLEDTVKS